MRMSADQAQVSQVKVEITTSSQQMKTYVQGPGKVPTITMNGNPFPQPKGGTPNFPSGLQVVVIDPAMDITSPASIRSNQYLSLPANNNGWMSLYQYMWHRAVTQIYTSGNTSQQIIFVATFGLDVNAAPTTDALELFLELGAGPQLQNWLTHVDVGSQSSWWCAFPGNYILIGQPQYGYGEGYEVYQRAQGDSVSTTLTATLTNFGQ
jgi:hypothetical protein